jgi:hypothetical protein
MSRLPGDAPDLRLRWPTGVAYGRMTMASDAARARALRSAEVVVNQRTVVRRLKGAGMDAALAELQLTKDEAQHAANLADWHRVR